MYPRTKLHTIEVGFFCAHEIYTNVNSFRSVFEFLLMDTISGTKSKVLEKKNVNERIIKTVWKKKNIFLFVI